MFSLETKNGDIGQGPESLKKTSVSKSLDPASIGPLYRSRLKKLKPQQMLATADVNEVSKPKLENVIVNACQNMDSGRFPF